MNIKKVRVAILLGAMLAMCLMLSGCNKDDGVDNPIVPPVSSGDVENGLNPPENVGSPDDINFGLEGPGDPNFDDVGLSGSQPGVSPVGDAEGEGQINYEIPTSTPDPDTSTLPDLSNQEGTGGDNSLGQVDPPLTTMGDDDDVPGPAPSETTPVDPPVDSDPPVENTEVPEGLKLPNTGMFLEDD